jgi:uncharacterized membrane protein
LQVEHSTLQGIAEVPSLIDKPLWSVRVSIDDEGIRMDFRWDMDDHERRSLLAIENSDCTNAIGAAIATALSHDSTGVDVDRTLE